MKSKNVLLWVCRIVSALIMLQTLYFKFTAAPESVHIFTMVGMEPEGRIATAIAELIASALILIPTTSAFGAGIALFIMLGAIATHLTILGIEVMDDGGRLFTYAVIVAIACLYIILKYTKRRKKVNV
ncbi:MAG TPA: hypothetical protein VM101_12635 [Flavitalea sp.]|nr:hypothetical protein [Flavitalea sp.]